MEVTCAVENNIAIPLEKSGSAEAFKEFVSDLVKLEVKVVFKGLSEEGVQAGKKEIESSRKK